MPRSGKPPCLIERKVTEEPQAAVCATCTPLQPLVSTSAFRAQGSMLMGMGGFRRNGATAPSPGTPDELGSALRLKPLVIRPGESKTMVKPSWNPEAIEKPTALQRDLTPGLGSRPKQKVSLGVCIHSDSSSGVALTALLHCSVGGPGNQGFCVSCNTLQVLAPSSLFMGGVCVCVCTVTSVVSDPLRPYGL